MQFQWMASMDEKNFKDSVVYRSLLAASLALDDDDAVF